MPEPQTESPSTGTVTAGLKNNLDGQFTANVKLTLEEFELGTFPDKLGQLNVFGGDVELKYPVGVGPLQAGLTLTYLHWKLPELGPVLGEVLIKGAGNYATDNNWGTTQGVETRLKTTYVRNLEVRMAIDFSVETKDNVETHGFITNVSATYKF